MASSIAKRARAPLGVVLLVDRDDATRRTYSLSLAATPVEVDEAIDGREALARAIARRPDLVITDTHLPGIDGFELCELLRRDRDTCTTPIIVLTTDAYPGDEERARQAGADTVLAKPCLPDVLVAETRRLMAQSAERRRHAATATAPVAQPKTRAPEVRAVELEARVQGSPHRILSRAFNRLTTQTPSQLPPSLVCPGCDRALAYLRSHIGGVSERQKEQWDYYECQSGCGTYQYRHRTRRLRRVS
jgi:two-component system cell cycle response regulator DivK